MAITRGSGGSSTTRRRVTTYNPVRKVTKPRQAASRAAMTRRLQAKPVQPAVKPVAKTDSTAAFAARLLTKPVQPFVPDSTAAMRARLLAKPVQPGQAVVSAPSKLPTPGGPGGSAATPGSAASSTSDADAKKAAEEDEAKAAAIAEADETLDLQLKAIEAQFGMTRAQLEADDGEAGRQYRQAKAGLMKQREQNLEANLNSMIERGIIRSGITLQNEADVREDFAEGSGIALGDRDYKRAQIAAQLAALGPQEAQAKSVATQDHERSILSLEQMRALTSGGL